MVLEPTGVHIWICHTADLSWEMAARQYQSLLSVDERIALKKMCVEEDKVNSLVGWIIVKTLVGLYTGLRHENVEIRRSKNRKPYISTKNTSIKFNISHSGSVVVCGFTNSGEIGVDIEQLDDKPRLINIAKRFFTKEEYLDIKNHNIEDQSKRFTSYWVLKEAYCKAIGEGLTIPLSNIQFFLPSISNEKPVEKIRYKLHKNMNKHDYCWDYFLINKFKNAKLAVALSKSSAQLNLVVRELKSFHEISNILNYYH